VETLPSRKSSVAKCVCEAHKEKMNQVKPAKRDDEMKNKDVNSANAMMRWEYMNHLMDVRERIRTRRVPYSFELRNEYQLR